MRTKEEIFQGMDPAEFVILSRLDFRFFAERVLGLKLAPFHLEWITLLDKHDKLIIAAPRGHGKTTIFGFAYPLWLLWKHKQIQILITSSNYAQAKEILDNLRNEIETNELLAELIPKKGTWSKDMITTSTRSKVIVKAYNPNIKGYHVNYVLCDEISEYKDKSVFFDVIMPTILKKKGKIVGIGTPVSFHDLLMELSNNKQFTFRKYSAIIKTESGEKPLWEESFSLEDLYTQKAAMGALAFQRQYMCEPVALESSLFPPNLVLEAIDENTSYSSTRKGTVYIGADLAISSAGDYSVFTVVDSTPDGIIVRKIERYRGLPIHAQVDKLMNLYETYKPATILVDISQFGHVVLEELREKGAYVEGIDFVPKNRNSMLIVLRQVLENQDLVIPAKGITERQLADILFEELTGFVVTKTPSGSETYQSTTAHDDMVMSLAMAVSKAKKHKGAPAIFFAD